MNSVNVPVRNCKHERRQRFLRETILEKNMHK